MAMAMGSTLTSGDAPLQRSGPDVQPVVGSKHSPFGQLHTVCWTLLVGLQLHAPIAHVFGKALLAAQQSCTPTAPPVDVQSAARPPPSPAPPSDGLQHQSMAGQSLTSPRARPVPAHVEVWQLPPAEAQMLPGGPASAARSQQLMLGDGWDGEGQPRFRSVYPSGHAPPNCSLAVNKHCPPDDEHVADAESAGASTASVAVSRTALRARRRSLGRESAFRRLLRELGCHTGLRSSGRFQGIAPADCA